MSKITDLILNVYDMFMESSEFSSDKIQKLKSANERLLINDKSNEPRDRNIIFVYCPPKVGSTSLVSSLRLFGYERYNVLHIHNESILKVLYNIDVTINELIKYNSLLGKNVYVIDIYRSPIEQKISIFFEKLEKFHFNNSVENMEKIPIETLITRFNNLFVHLGDNDYYRNEYNITYPESFNFEKKYIIKNMGNIQYIKLRLQDSSSHWRTILRAVLNIDVVIVHDYETADKPVKNIFKRFMDNYRIPENLLEDIKQSSDFTYYNSSSESMSYLNSWKRKMTSAHKCFSIDEYNLYLTISGENQYMSEIQRDHYIDNGCNCNGCKKKRFNIRERIKRGENITTKIKHEEIKENKNKVFQKRLVNKVVMRMRM